MTWMMNKGPRVKGCGLGISGQRWSDENHQKTGFKLIPFLFPIIQAEQK
jgi:hypothetical protein